MAQVAVIGMGLLGSGFALNLIEKGHSVRVWNRTRSKCDEAEAAGATVSDSAAEAVRGVDRVHLILSDDAVVEAVIDACRAGLGEGVPVIDHSTNLPASVGERTARLEAEGIRYVHAPVFMGPKNSRAATGMMLLSGDHPDLVPLLEDMTGSLVTFPGPTTAATLKIAGNGLIMQSIAGMRDLFSIADADGLPREALLSFMKGFSPFDARMGARILKSEPGHVSFALEMARKDVRLMIEAGGDDLITLPAIAQAMDAHIEEGQGGEDFTAFVR